MAGQPRPRGHGNGIDVGSRTLRLLQDAVPVRLGQEFGGYAKPVRRDADRARQRAIAQLQALGYRVTLEPLAA